MAQLNLICHGMMLFVEDGQTLEILIPMIAEHDYRIGAPAGLDCGPYPEDLAGGSYTLGGVPQATRGGLSQLDPNQHLLLHRDRFDLVRDEHIAITTPAPDRVRLFRRVGPPDVDVAHIIFGSVPHDTALATPTYLHDVIALIYDNIPDGTTVTFGSVRTVVVRKAAPTTIDVYSQIGPGVMAQDTGTRSQHPTAINDLLTLRSNGQHPTFMLSAVGKAASDNPAGDGISRCDVLSLFELAHFVTDGTGCSSAFLLQR